MTAVQLSTQCQHMAQHFRPWTKLQQQCRESFHDSGAVILEASKRVPTLQTTTRSTWVAGSPNRPQLQQPERGNRFNNKQRMRGKRVWSQNTGGLSSAGKERVWSQNKSGGPSTRKDGNRSQHRNASGSKWRSNKALALTHRLKLKLPTYMYMETVQRLESGNTGSQHSWAYRTTSTQICWQEQKGQQQ